MTESTQPTDADLEAAEYHELQAYAKDAGVPATGKADELRQALRDHFGYDGGGVGPGEPETSQEAPEAKAGDRAYRALVAMARSRTETIPAGALFLASPDSPLAQPGNAVEVTGDELPDDVAAALAEAKG